VFVKTPESYLHRIMLVVAMVLGGIALSPAAGRLQLTWVQPSPLTIPSSRFRHALAYDSVRQNTLLFGGSPAVFGVTTFLADTWSWDGTNWTLMQPATSPAARNDHAMVFDSATSNVLLYGGLGSAFQPLADTWVFDGTTWTQQSPAKTPGARNGHGLAYDSLRQQVVLFGGSTGQAITNDTWVWNGTTWAQLSPGMNPPARYQHSMAFDEAHGYVVLFGGFQPDQDHMWNDTWIWDGTNWQQQFPATSPSNRAGAALAFSAEAGGILFFGGTDRQTDGSTLFRNDLWLWNGTTWVNLSPIGAPPFTESSAMVYDAARHQHVLLRAGEPGIVSPLQWSLSARSVAGGQITSQ
jgi:hypothetical protein